MACNGLAIRQLKLGEQQLTRVQILRRQLTLDLGLGLGAFVLHWHNIPRIWMQQSLCRSSPPHFLPSLSTYDLRLTSAFAGIGFVMGNVYWYEQI